MWHTEQALQGRGQSTGQPAARPPAVPLRWRAAVLSRTSYPGEDADPALTGRTSLATPLSLQTTGKAGRRGRRREAERGSPRARNRPLAGCSEL